MGWLSFEKQEKRQALDELKTEEKRWLYCGSFVNKEKWYHVIILSRLSLQLPDKMIAEVISV